VTQLPAEQTWFVPHTRPHAPQLLPSVCASTQAPLQKVPPLGHAQPVAPHACPPEHTVPHAPQFWLSVAVFVHCVPHNV
jgi:hypothetical protein